MTSPDASAYDRCEAVGEWTAPFLAEHPEAERELAARFRARVEEAAQPAPAPALPGTAPLPEVLRAVARGLRDSRSGGSRGVGPK